MDSPRTLCTPTPSGSLRQIGKYDLVEKLGEGGFGVVYKARHSVTLHAVAIKILSAQAGAQPEVAARFRREASIGNEIDHENIVRALDFGEVEGQPYLVLELLDGMSLAEAVRTGGPMAPARAAAIAYQVADALEAAHAHGVIHRDLKPENIFLVRRSGRAEVAKVLDFGIAKLTAGASDGLQTGSQVLIGSPVTMSPEQCRGADIDARSDVYALGVVLFYAVAGRYPFTGAQADILSAHLRDPPPRLGDLRPGVPATLEAVVARALAKETKRRFQSMRELRWALGPLAGEAPAAAATLAARRGAGPPPRRGARAWARVAAALLLVALAGAGAGAWLHRRRASGPMAASAAVATTTAAGKGTHAPATEARAATNRLAAKAVPQGDPSVAAPVRGTALRVSADAGEGPEKRTGRVGYLTVAVLPFAEVLVDGHAAGTTPLRRLPLAVGTHTIVLRNAGLNRIARRSERIEPGAHRRIQVDWSN